MKTLKKTLSTILAIASALAITTTSYAVYPETEYHATSDETNEYAEFTLISQEESIDENGFLIIDRTYIKNMEDTENYSLLRASNAGKKTITKTKSVYADNSSSGDLWLEMSITGDFEWNQDKDTATVQNVKQDKTIRNLPDYVTLYTHSPTYKSNQGKTMLLGYKYAYIQTKFEIKNTFGATTNFEMWLDVNVKGDVNFKAT
jgi:hypothetical protein